MMLRLTMNCVSLAFRSDLAATSTSIRVVPNLGLNSLNPIEKSSIMMAMKQNDCLSVFLLANS